MLAAPRGEGGDTAALMPKGVVTPPFPMMAPEPPVFRPGGLVYEVQVRGFTMLHPDIPEARPGTIDAPVYPAVTDHLRPQHGPAVELMPLTHAIIEFGRANCRCKG